MKIARLLLYSIAIPALVLALLGMPVPAHASGITWTVNSLGDGAANAANCPGTGCRLRDALAAASSGDTIKFGVTGTITLHSGELRITDENLNIQGPGATLLTIDGNNASRIFRIFASSPLGHTVTIAKLKIQHGLAKGAANGATGYYPAGGAIFDWGGILHLNSMVITSNKADCGLTCNVGNGLDGSGGGVAAASGSALAISNSTISSNTASKQGGGIFFNSGTTSGEVLTLTNDTISGNSALDPAAGDGGGISIAYANAATVTGTTVSNNTAYFLGGGLEALAPVTITGSTFTSNTAKGPGFLQGGGGIYMSGGTGTFAISTSTISGNVSENGGGGGIVDNTGTATINQSTIKDNKANTVSNSNGGYGGGGILILGGNNLTLSNSTITGNTTPNEGGGVSNNGATLQAWNDTFTANAAGSTGQGGGGLYSINATTTLYNSTLAGNTTASGHGGGLFVYSGSSALSNNLLAKSTSSSTDCAEFSTTDLGSIDNFIQTIDATYPCNGYINGLVEHDPLLGALANNGGPTQTKKLLAGSPALGQGSSIVCANVSYVNGLDQRGKPRPAACDVGAYEDDPQTVLPYKTSLSFATQLIGTSSPVQVVTVTNAGDHALTLSGISTAAPYTLLSTGTCPLSSGTIAAWGSCTLKVQFSPTASVSTPGNIAIQSNDAAHPTYNIPLSGSGTAGTQLLQNQSFEIDANSDQKPDSWTYANFNSATDKRDSAAHQAGAYSLKLVGNGTNKTASQTVMQSGSKGDDFTFSLWSKASSVPTGGTYEFEALFYNGTTLLSTQTVTFATGTHIFQQAQGKFTAPSAYTKILFRITFKEASGSAWFDNAALNWAP